MATRIDTLNQEGNTILPRTVSKAVTMEDGTNLEYAINNRSTDTVKISAEVAEALGLVEGTDLSTLIINQSRATANTLASAEII